VIPDDVRLFHHLFQLDIETGVGLTVGQGSDPVVVLRWSNDGGHTWSNERTGHIGVQGAYDQRVLWNRLGHARDRVYEVSGTDPVKIVITGAYLDASAGHA
jgi:hypothetical protein